MGRQKKLKIDEIAHHTVKKFEIISKYVSGWTEKLLNYPKCKGIVFIDCMSNCGIYKFKRSGKIIDGTALRVMETFYSASLKYPNKIIKVYFNDYNELKIQFLEKTILEKYPNLPNNLVLSFTCEDSSDFLMRFTQKGLINQNTLLVYDPYNATINWKSIKLFLNTWGEVILNHMVSDPIRGVSSTANEKSREKYEATYGRPLELLEGNTCDDYQQIIENRIRSNIFNKKDSFIYTVPFYNIKNAHVYNLIHITHNLIGFNLFKTCVWQLCGLKSAVQSEDGFQQSFFESSNPIKKNCYNFDNLTNYIWESNHQQLEVNLNDIYEDLKKHRIYPCAFKNEIRKDLKEKYGCSIKNKNMIYFPKRMVDKDEVFSENNSKINAL